MFNQRIIIAAFFHFQWKKIIASSRNYLYQRYNIMCTNTKFVLKNYTSICIMVLYEYFIFACLLWCLKQYEDEKQLLILNNLFEI